MGTERGLDPFWSLCPLKISACGILGPEDSEVETVDNRGRVQGGLKGVPPDGSSTPGAGRPGGKGMCRESSWERDRRREELPRDREGLGHGADVPVPSERLDPLVGGRCVGWVSHGSGDLVCMVGVLA